MANSFEELVTQIKDRLDILDVVSQQVILKKMVVTIGDYALSIKKKLRHFL